MQINRLNERIHFQQAKVQADEIGNRKNGWNEVYSCYATITNESPQEQTSNGLIWDSSKIDFTVRYCKWMEQLSSTQYRIRFHGELYRIEGIDHMNFQKKMVKLHCQKEIYHESKSEY